MLKKFSCTVILIPFVILLNGAMLAVEMIMLRAGTGSLNNAEKLPYYPGWYVVLVSIAPSVPSIPMQFHLTSLPPRDAD